MSLGKLCMLASRTKVTDFQQYIPDVHSFKTPELPFVPLQQPHFIILFHLAKNSDNKAHQASTELGNLGSNMYMTWPHLSWN